MLSDVDNKFDELFLKENIIKQGYKFPNKIKNSIIKGKLIEEHWNENKLNSSINDCLNIEHINKISETIKNNNSTNISLQFYPLEKDISEFLEKIKLFGKIEKNNYNKFNSNIEFDQELVKSWLNNRAFKSELLFRKSRDGSTRFS